MIDMQNGTRALHWFYTYQHLQCEWNVTVQVGRTIAVEFPMFNVPSVDTTHCAENYIMVSNSAGATASTLSFCRTASPVFRVEEQQHLLCHSYSTSFPQNTLPCSPFESTNKIQNILFQKLVYLYSSFVFTAKKWKIPGLPDVGTGQILWYTSSKKYS